MNAVARRCGRRIGGPPQAHRNLPVAAGRSPRRRLADRVRAPDRLPAALPVLRHRLRLPRRRVVGHRRDPGRSRQPRRAPRLRHRRRAAGAEALHRAAAARCATPATTCRWKPPARSTSPRSTRACRAWSTSRRPGSGEVARNRWENLPLLTAHDQVKFVICDRADYDWARDIVAEHRAGTSAATCCSRRATRRSRRASSPTGSSPTACRCASRCSCTSCCGTTSPDADRMDVSAAKPAVVLVSGGMDSAVVLAIAREQGFAVHALSVRYGQRHTSELDAADRVARALGAVAHKTVSVDLRSIGGSALTDRHRRAAGFRPAPGGPASRSPTCRRATPSCCRSRWAGPKCSARADIFCGVNAVDYSGYPGLPPGVHRRLRARSPTSPPRPASKAPACACTRR